jgi:exo-beta-1,3-glucanase (GH17 family)
MISLRPWSLELSFRICIVAVYFSATAFNLARAGDFPFTKDANRFYLNGQPVFLNMIGYQPLEPDQAVTGELRETRVLDDLRRLASFAGGSQPVLLRVYAQPTTQFPNRLRKSFYDEVRRLGFWIVRDIYFDSDWMASDAKDRGRQKIDAVIAEVTSANAFDRIFAWEVGNEFAGSTYEQRTGIADFINTMRAHLKSRMTEADKAGWSDWVTWGSWPPSDPLRSSATVPTGSGGPILPELDYVSYNAYTFWPERVRFAGCGPVTGTPYAGYLAALKVQHPTVPLMISETGYPDSPVAVGENQDRLHPWYPNYRRGALSPPQIAEALADRYWDARLTGLVAGLGYFEWNDETWKGAGGDQAEPHFGLMRLLAAGSGGYEGRFKLQAQVVRDLFTLKLPAAAPVVTGVTADKATLVLGESTFLHAIVASGANSPMRFRWECSRGWIVGDGETVTFFAGTRALGSALVTVAGIDADNNASIASVTLQIQAGGSPVVEFLTLGDYRVSGRVASVDLSTHKLSVWIETNLQYVQPFADATGQYISKDGYWWSYGWGFASGTARAYVVPQSWTPPSTLQPGIIPPGTIAQASRTLVNDSGNDLLPDAFASDPYADTDDDGALNLEELLAGTSPVVADNDQDHDGLPDNWERNYFGHLSHGAGDDSDQDGLLNSEELALALHPGRTGVDSDRDGQPDTWELQFFGNLNRDGTGDANQDGISDRDSFELGLTPTPSPPTAAGLAYFTATRTPGGIVIMNWGTLVEVGVIGFHLDCYGEPGGWRRITETLIPATGTNQQPQHYRFLDETADTKQSSSYRLVSVDLTGRRRIVAETFTTPGVSLSIQTTASTLRVRVEGNPAAKVRLESCTALGPVPWGLVQSLTLDNRGVAQIELPRRDSGGAAYLPGGV